MFFAKIGVGIGFFGFILIFFFLLTNHAGLAIKTSNYTYAVLVAVVFLNLLSHEIR